MKVQMLKGQKVKRGAHSSVEYRAGLKYDVPDATAIEWIYGGIAEDPDGIVKKPEPEPEGAEPAGGEG